MREERTLYQKIVLVILAAMIVVFGVITAVNQSNHGIRFGGGFLRKEETTDADCFIGQVNEEQVTILRWYGNENDTRTITLRVGERIHDTYTVYLGEPMIPLDEIAVTALQVSTVRITNNETAIFEGGYQESSGLFFTAEGEWPGLNLDVKIHVSGADPWENYTMTKGQLVQLALAPELIDRGDWRLYGIMVLFTLVTMVDVAFPNTLFRWRHRRWVKDPEPTDDYMSMQHLAWMIALPVLLAFYIWTSFTLANVT